MKGAPAVSKGFSARERIDRPPEDVWAYLTDFRNAKDWMTGVEGLSPKGEGPIEIGTRLSFRARGKERMSRVSALEPGRQLALTSTQGGVTATYTYALAPDGDGTEVTLEAVCQATGAWRLLHPVIAMAMKRSDSSQLANLKLAMGG